jgi:hypothetical protein
MLRPIKYDDAPSHILVSDSRTGGEKQRRPTLNNVHAVVAVKRYHSRLCATNVPSVTLAAIASRIIIDDGESCLHCDNDDQETCCAYSRVP